MAEGKVWARLDAAGLYAVYVDGDLALAAASAELAEGFIRELLAAGYEIGGVA